MHYTIHCLPMKCISTLNYTQPLSATNKPCFYKGTFDAKAGVDTFVDMAGWHKGCVWVNGFNLGRYWNIGPQRTLYLPGELLKDKNNVIEILELHSPKADFSVNCLDEPLLCEKIDNDILSSEFRLL